MTARSDCICLKDIRRRCVNCRVLPFDTHDVACRFCDQDSPETAPAVDVLPGQTRFTDDGEVEVYGEHGDWRELAR